MIEIEVDPGESDDVTDRSVITRVAHSMSVGTGGRTGKDEFTPDLSEMTKSGKRGQ
jgi:hypothetical protein